MRKAILIPLVALGVLGPAVSSADLMIGSAQIEIRTIVPGYDPGYFTVESSTDSAEALHQFGLGDQVCDAALEGEITQVGNQTAPCRVGSSFYATLISLVIEQDQDVMWEFGTDWGRGGIIFGSMLPSEIVVDSNIWWNSDWNDAISFVTTNTGLGTLNFLGFEDCCSDNMSLRYSLDQGQTWVAATVPEPGTLALLGLGLAGLGFSRRNKI
jgi:hypothetical protein